ncbi:MAG: hypothetical protein QW835_00105 [Candidatus Hadarchaeum sp.]
MKVFAVPEKLCVPFSPWDDRACDGLRGFREYASFVYDSAYTMDYGTVSDLLWEWSWFNRGWADDQSRLAVLFFGQMLLEAYLLLPFSESIRVSKIFRPWVRAVFRRAAEIEAGALNFRGSWGLLGIALSDFVLNHDTPWLKDRVLHQMRENWTEDGVMFREARRTNSGIWCCYLSLAALFRTCQLKSYGFISRLIIPLRWLWQFVLDPASWPYRLPVWPLGVLWRLVFPCTDIFLLPRRDGWPANLYLEAGTVFGIREWADYAQFPLDSGLNIYRESRFMALFSKVAEIGGRG